MTDVVAKPTTVPLTQHSVYQTSLMAALLDGIYDGEMTVGELLGHGSFGLGTFNALDGEMIILDGRCYQLRSDGTCTPASMDQKTPFAAVTNFVTHVRREITKPMMRSEVSEIVDSLTLSPNYLYAMRITGKFRSVRTRTVVRQAKPYPPMVEASDGEPVQEFDNVEGVVAGFRTPLYEQGISVPGCHVHFVDDARTAGGHVLDFFMESGSVELCIGTDLQLSLPRTVDFVDANLTPEDIAAQIEKTENKR